MQELMNCPDCKTEIYSRMGTICPNCGFTVGYFNGTTRRRKYGRFFALSVFAPFLSFITILFSQQNKYLFLFAIALYFYLAIKSCPMFFKDIFVSKFEKMFFWLVWLFLNLFLLVLVINILYKGV